MEQKAHNKFTWNIVVGYLVDGCDLNVGKYYILDVKYLGLDDIITVLSANQEVGKVGTLI